MAASVPVTPITSATTAALVLAGGQSRRMGGPDKASLPLAGSPLLTRIVRRLQPQVGQVLLNLNRPVDLPELAALPVVADILPGFPGPLTGLVSGLQYLDRAVSETESVRALLLVPCDGPFVPLDLAERLRDALGSGGDVACIRYMGEVQPTFSLWRTRCRHQATRQLLDAGRGGFKGLLRELDTVYVDWPAGDPNPFFNINTPEDLRAAERLLEASCH